jgi:DNA-binding transcriptional MocR family regulator
VEWVRPDAGALCCIRLKPAMFDDEAVPRFYQAATDAGVRVANGEWFGEQARVLRLGFGLLDAADLQAGLNALSRTLRETASREAETVGA